MTHGAGLSSAPRIARGFPVPHSLPDPGSPGVVKPPNPIFTENFENAQGTTPIRLPDYVGALGTRYTADPPWLVNCNGWVSSFSNPVGSSSAVAAQVKDCTPATGGPGTPGATAWNRVRQLAQALGVLDGSATPDSNHAVSAYTNGSVNSGNPGAGYVEFKTVDPLPMDLTGRFLTMSVNVAELSCAANKNHALLDFYLVHDGVKSPVNSTPIDPCTAGGSQFANSIWAGTYQGTLAALIGSPSTAVKGAPRQTASTVGIEMVNEQGSGDGNDHAFDDIMLLDETPQLDKSFDPPLVQTGGTSRLTFTITNNTGLQAKDGWLFTDTLPSGLTVASDPAASTTCGAGTTINAAAGGTSVGVTNGDLLAGQASCTVTVNVTSDTAGTFTNTPANMTSLFGLNPPGTAAVQFTDNPTIGLTPLVTPPFYNRSEQTLTYTYTVTNASTVTLDDVHVDPTLMGMSTPVCAVTTLAPGQSTTCTATYTTTDADVAAGKINDNATATGTQAGTTTEVTSAPAPTTVPLITTALTLKKTATPATYSEPGQLIAYDFVVTDTSEFTMTNIAVRDRLPGLSSPYCPRTTLAPGQSEHCVATYLTTAVDLDAGSVPNTAIAGAIQLGGTIPQASNESSAVIRAERKPGITVRKTASPVTFSRAGQVIRYTFHVTNTGNVTLTGVRIADHLAGLSSVTCPRTTLAAGASETCTATYRITAADVHAGSVANTAVARGNPPAGMREVSSGGSTATIRHASLRIHKTASPGVFRALGQLIRFSFRVTNTGQVTLSHIAISDTLRGLSAIRCPSRTLRPGKSETCTATYRITRADIRAGSVTNHAVAHGTTPHGSRVASGRAAVIVHEEVPVTGGPR